MQTTLVDNSLLNQKIESLYANATTTQQNTDLIIVSSECLKAGNLSLSKKHSNIIRFVQQNTTSIINWKEKGITLSDTIESLKKDSTFNFEMKNIVLGFIKNLTSDTTQIDTLEKGLAFLETERKLSDLVSKQQISLETAKETLTKCLKFGSQEDFDLDKLNEFNTFLENPQNKDISKKLGELFNHSEVIHEAISLQLQQEVTEAIPHSTYFQNINAKLVFENLGKYSWESNQIEINKKISGFFEKTNEKFDEKLLGNIQKTLEKEFGINKKNFNAAWATAISKTHGSAVIDNGPVTLKFGEKEVKMKMTFTPQAKMSGFTDDTAIKHCSSIYQNATIGDTKHAVNLWKQDIALPSSEGQSVQSMSFLRHGYILEQETAAKEILANACILQHGEEAILNATKEKPLSLNFSNIQLMSLGQFADADKPLKQMEMFNLLASNEKQPLELKYGENTIYVKFEKPLLFNFGVNAQYFRQLLKNVINAKNHKDLTTNESKVKEQNLESFKQLFGENFPDSNKNNFGGLIKTKLEALGESDPQKSKQIQTLANQILDIYQAHPEGLKENPYALPTRVLALTNLLGYAGSFNCKSGKDRTGVCAMELSNLCAQMMSGEEISNPMRPISDEEQENLQTIYKEGSCVRDIPRINTVLQKGLKTDPDLFFNHTNNRFGIDLTKSFEGNMAKLNSQNSERDA